MTKKLSQTLNISPITLGTVQFGIKYGIANQRGFLSDEEVEKILKYAFDHNITSLDTAPAYGESERRIGMFVRNQFHIQDPPITIVTKIASIEITPEDTYKTVYSRVRNSVEKSILTLGLKKIPICLLHSVSNMQNELIIKSMKQIKSENLIDYIGVSVYTPEDVEAFLKIDDFDAIQIPINVFDQRLIHSGLLKRLHEKNIIVFARSIFLQGLFFLESSKIPPNLAEAQKFLSILHDYAKKKEISVAQLALGFVKNLPEIRSLVLGVESIEQINQNLKDFNDVHLDEKDMEELQNLFTGMPELIINPSKWNQKK